MLVASPPSEVETIVAPAVAARLEQQIADMPVMAGDAVVLRGVNSPVTAATLFALLRRSVSALMVPDSAPAAQIASHAKAVGAAGVVGAMGEAVAFDQIASASERRDRETGIYLLSSGSTGQAKTVFRPLSTWEAEAHRYQTLLSLGPRDRTLILAPISHAYALGWLWAAWQARAQIDLVQPTDMGAAQDRLTNWASHACLTPNIAKLLALRSKAPQKSERLKVVMAGAGPLTERLDRDFVGAFGLRLSTNYGSTEAGGLFANIAPARPGTIGRPMPGVAVDVPPNAPSVFPLTVKLSDGNMHAMGDLVSVADGIFRVVGRAGSSIRRGERWVSPLEIEAALLDIGAVADCRVEGIAGAEAGNDRINATVVPAPGQEVIADDLRHLCKARLAPHLIPDRFDISAHIDRTERGKVPARPRYELSDMAAQIDVMNAYKRSHLFFALYDLGILDQIERGASTGQIALRLGVPVDWLGKVLAIARLNGILCIRDESEAARGRTLSSVEPLAALESKNLSGLNSVTALKDTIVSGGVREAEGARSLQAEIADPYFRAMNGKHKARSRLIVARRLMRLNRPIRVLDVSATGGMYARTLLDRELSTPETTCVLPVGKIDPETNALAHLQSITWNDLVSDCSSFDLIVLDNALHHAAAIINFDALLSARSPGGTVVIDDLFLAEQDGEIGVDWLTHGGVELIDDAAFQRFAHGKGLSPCSLLNNENQNGFHRLYWLEKSN